MAMHYTHSVYSGVQSGCKSGNIENTADVRIPYEALIHIDQY